MIPLCKCEWCGAEQAGALLTVAQTVGTERLVVQAQVCDECFGRAGAWVPSEKAIANARLRIAAPALLDAARMALRWLQVFFPAPPLGGPIHVTQIALDNAITLAEGPPEPSDPYFSERAREQQDLFEARQREVAE